ncbi:MAG: M14 family metallopeptidase [Bacteroidetes bacterium]|nr:M14 family metallopeptidase [Bacteroidota bacterium]
MKYLLIFFLLFSLSFSQLTRPEKTNYEETSRYEDVMNFLNEVLKNSTDMKMTTLGVSTEGKRLPMIVYGNVPNPSPEAVKKSGKLCVYIQGNIHAGEVEGKEAVLQILREIKNGRHQQWKKHLVILWVPIFNADGNDKISLYNREYQNGPVAGMGTRENGQGLDLNRDHMKLESPEVLSFVKVLNEYDPAVTVDLHTTNGSFHAYQLTYGYALNPNLEPKLDNFSQKIFFPEASKRMLKKKWRTRAYGDYMERTPAGKPGYYFWAHQPRFNHNYVGLRNRLSVLSEAYSYIPFKERIRVTKDFVETLLDLIIEQAESIRKLETQADEISSSIVQQDSLAVRAEIAESNPALKVLLAPPIRVRNPYSNEVMFLMNEDSIHEIVTTEFEKAIAKKKAAVPSAYIIPDSLSDLLGLLDAQGIRYSRTAQTQTMTVQKFQITENKPANYPFQKHTMRTLNGQFETVTAVIPAHSILVPMTQPLSRIVFYLLEPESEDGAAAWNLLDSHYGDGKYFPILKVVQ